MFKPLNKRLFLRPQETTTRPSGIIVTAAKEDVVECDVVGSASELAKVGDRVLVLRGNISKFSHAAIDYHSVKEEALLAIEPASADKP